MGGKKKFNNNKFNNKPEKEEVKEQTIIQEEKLEMTENPSISAQEEIKEIKEEKTKADKTRGRSRKLKKSDVAADNLAQTVINEDTEIAPIIAENANLNKTEETKTEASETKIETKSEEAEVKPVKRSRRPNRNSQKRTRKTTKKNAEE